MKFAPNKTHLFFSGKALKPQDEVEILGISFDKKVTFKTHTKEHRQESIKKTSVLETHFMASGCKRKRGPIQSPNALCDGVCSPDMERSC